jgi:hypothetical protein
MTAASKSTFSSGPNKSSKDALALRRRVVLVGAAAVRRVLRVGALVSVAGLREVLRVLRTGRSSVAVVGAAERRVLRTGAAGEGSGSCVAGALGRAPGPTWRGVREGPLGVEAPGGPDAAGPVGGPRLRVGGDCLPPDGGPRPGMDGPVDGGLCEG